MTGKQANLSDYGGLLTGTRHIFIIIPVFLKFFTVGFPVPEDPVDHPEKKDMHQNKKNENNEIRSTNRWQHGIDQQKSGCEEYWKLYMLHTIVYWFEHKRLLKGLPEGTG